MVIKYDFDVHNTHFLAVYRQWKTFDIDDVNQSGPFYLRTPFGAFFNYIADTFCSQMDILGAG